MIDACQNYTLLRLLHYGYLVRSILAARDSGRRQAEQHRSAFYAQLWQDAAASLGATCEPLGYGILEIRRGPVRVRVFENSCPLDDPVTLAIAGKKVLVHRLLERAGLPIPRYAEFTLRQMDRAVAFLEDAAGDCVVKPANDTGAGWGVTTGIRSRPQLARAAAAAGYGCDLIIEEQAPGATYRLLYLEGRLLDAVRRSPPTVVADGCSTVRDLVRRANRERLHQGYALSQVLLTADLDMRYTLAKQGLSLRSVPAAGTVVPLKTVINQNAAPENISATGSLCPALIADGARAAEAVGARLAGVDVITRDPGVPLAESGGVILEVNTTPGYHYHYHKKDGPCAVAVPILKRLLALADQGAGGKGGVPDPEVQGVFQGSTFSTCRWSDKLAPPRRSAQPPIEPEHEPPQTF